MKIPKGEMKFLGYVIQQHNIRNTNESGMTKGWEKFGNRLEESITKNIVDVLKPYGRVVATDDFSLGKIPNLHSLIPYSLSARKPVFDCKYADGLRGDHINKAKDSEALFEDVVSRVISVIT